MSRGFVKNNLQLHALQANQMPILLTSLLLLLLGSCEVNYYSILYVNLLANSVIICNIYGS